MKLLFLIITFSIFQSLSAQRLLIPDTIYIDSNSKLMGWYSHTDEEKTYAKWNFLIDQPEEIRKMLKQLTVGEETQGAYEDTHFTISLIQNHKEVIHCLVIPRFKCVQRGYYFYTFDPDKLILLNKAYPLEYTFNRIIFKTKDEYVAYLERQRSDTTFLFSYEPSFAFEGSFDVEFPNNNRFSSPKAISEYLAPQIEKIVGKNEYLLGYPLNEKNMNNQTQFTMSIDGSKKLFDMLELKKGKKANWHPTEEAGYFFYRTRK